MDAKQSPEYPGQYGTLVTALRAMAYDNGIINAGYTEQECIANAMPVLLAHFNRGEAAQLRTVDAELAALTPQQLGDLCCGGEDQRPAVSAEAEAVLEFLFNIM